MSKSESMFKTHLESHRDLGDLAEKKLRQSDENELPTPALAGEIHGETDMSRTYVRALLTEGIDWIIENHDVAAERRPERTGGSPTIYWRLDSQ